MHDPRDTEQAAMSETGQVTQAAMSEIERVAREHLRIVADGDEGAIAGNVTADYRNHRSADEPLAARQRGPAGLQGTIRWLHRAFTDLRFECHEAVVTGDRVALYVTLHGRQHGPFVVHDAPDARVTDVFPATGRTFAAKQTHWFTVVDGAVAEHDAVRDDLAMAKQLGWIPPRPGYIVRMVLAARAERRAVQKAMPSQ